MKIFLLNESNVSQKMFLALAISWQLEHDEEASMSLVKTSNHLELRSRSEPYLKGLYIDFTSRAMLYRRRFGGAFKEALAIAVGAKKSYLPSIVDATAGLGRDAFVLSCLGCNVRMIERNPVVSALLYDGLQRAYKNTTIGKVLKRNLILLKDTNLNLLYNDINKPEIVYLDPMYPSRNKSAKIKKDMRFLQQLVGLDEDADLLLEQARLIAQKRVVVKRPKYAPPLAGVITYSKVTTKNHRFDIYSPL
ncbi:class I SAM-dependent methyltransferase [Candidatus Ishikawella capsulata]|uniref:Ribosomal RNA small subunit methyltransferase J n=1 Tax=Candidatus Ishikawaella capsulata Mpkobe TaxID=476281 RepID=C5WC51_9ENTR|nr:class I SAM-dependent methyltransferase [Candidatus Ishikawaella capsulata]BAH82907.1 predicted SAM-dependent methyltransferase [Candidatus Ishikawaella capsulata Mpkobe]